MLKEAIEKIQELSMPIIFKNENNKSFVVTKDGEAYEIRDEIDFPDVLKLNSLDSLVQMIQVEALGQYNGPYFVKIPSPTEVVCFLQVEKENRFVRKTIYQSFATDIPGWEDETRLTFERAAVALQTRFQDSPDRQYALQLLSQITTGAKVTYNDTGIATTVVTTKGVSLQQNTTIKPIVKLKPYRTFQEIDQPEGLFLIRIDERGITFTAADGGMWKLEARKTIKKYLEEKLKDSSGVVVML